MDPLDHLFQERLAQLEAGESEEKCLADLPQDEALGLRKAIALRDIAHLVPLPGSFETQRADFLRFAKEKRSATMNLNPKKQGNRWILPAALAGGVITIFACLVIFSLVTGLAGMKFVTQLPEAVREVLPRQGGDSAASTTQAASPTQTAAIKPQAPQNAALAGLYGLVEVQDENGQWAAVQNNAQVQAPQHIRTGDLSSVTLKFYDGSEARLGPNSELSVDRLVVQEDGYRVISLTQISGESDHQVAASKNPESRYEVDTPAGQGTARGTRFHVTVSLTLFVRFDVDEGEVEFTNLNTTLIVVAGQSTTCAAGQAPSGPFFHEQGEGRVERVGATWRIAGNTLQTNTNTVTIGNPQVGDWVGYEAIVLLDGTRIVYRIFLLQREQKNQFEIRGVVETISPTQWGISGRAVQVNETTLIDAGIKVGDTVKVTGFILSGGALTATRIQLTVDMTSLKFDITGVVQAISDTAWTISGAPIAVNSATEIEAGITTGEVVRAQGQIQEDGAWLAQKIRRADENNREFMFVGQVESMDPWRVSGVSFETDSDTQINSRISLGDRVRVSGRILEDGRWLARNIQLLEDVTQNEFEFWGVVNSTDPWIIGGVALAVDGNTVIQGKTAVSRLVHVKGEVLPDGTLLAREIIGQDLRQGCLTMSSAVRQINSNQVVLFNWQVIRLGGGVTIQGEVQVATVVLVSGCVGEDGTFIISNVIVIAQLKELPSVDGSYFNWNNNSDDKNKDKKHHDEDDDHDD